MRLGQAETGRPGAELRAAHVPPGCCDARSALILEDAGFEAVSMLPLAQEKHEGGLGHRPDQAAHGA